MTTIELKFEMGDKVQDKITGFTGTITGFTRHITGCDQYCIMPRAKETHDYPKGQWIDENRIQPIEQDRIVNIDTDKSKGAMEAPPVN